METRLCSYCGLEKEAKTFISRRRCWDCALIRKCYTCGDYKPVTDFPQETSKGCKSCRESGLAKQKKSVQSAQRYQADSKSFLDHNKEWKQNNRARYHSQQRDYRNRQRAEKRDHVLAHYGGGCACCGESRPLFLTIDHIEGNGALHRRMIGKTDMWKWLYANDYPDGFQLLCFNCNAGKFRNGGRCPHEDERAIP